MKVLILSCNTGGGHNSAAKALAESFGRSGTECRVLDTFSLISKGDNDIISKTYIGIARRTPHLFGYMYEAGALISSDKRKSPVYAANMIYADALLKFLKENEFDTVLCPHLFPAEALTYIRRKYAFPMKYYGVATDYTCSPFWEETDIDAFFIPHADIAQECADRGIPADKLIVTGIPVSERFSMPHDRDAACFSLGLDPQLRYYLIMTGSMGFGNMTELPQTLIGDSDTLGAIVLTGSNMKLRRTLDARYKTDPRVRAVGFTDEVALYMDACDVLLTKPGGLSTTEAAVRNIGLVHTKPIPGCETKNAEFFSSRWMSVRTLDPDESVRAARLLMNSDVLRSSMCDRQRENINPRAADKICDYVLKHASGGDAQ